MAPDSVSPALQRFTFAQVEHGEDLRWMDTSELVDRATMKASHLVAMLEITYGGGAEGFQALSTPLQDEYLWACSTVARELRATIRELTTQRRSEADRTKFAAPT